MRWDEADPEIDSIALWRRVTAALADTEEPPPCTLTVKGNSMYPLIRSGKDRVTVLPVGKRVLRRGDIVLFLEKAGGLSYVLHRIYRIRGEKLQTLGDGNGWPDGWISRDRILGVVTEIERGSHRINPDSGWMRFAAECWMRLLGQRGRIMKILCGLNRIRRGQWRKAGDRG